jgi:hypothetical protein
VGRPIRWGDLLFFFKEISSVDARQASGVTTKVKKIMSRIKLLVETLLGFPN